MRPDAALALGVMIVAVSCTVPERPALEEWASQWEEAQALTAWDESSAETDVETFCHVLLTGARQIHGTLLPTPDHALDGPVREWLSETESLGFQCPGGRGDPAAHRAAMKELRVLEAEIAAGLQALSQEAETS